MSASRNNKPSATAKKAGKATKTPIPEGTTKAENMEKEDAAAKTKTGTNKRTLSPSSQKRRAKAIQDKRDNIMQAALTLFSQHGVKGTSVEQIAERADVSKTNLLYYFSSKDQLYLEVIKHLLQVWLVPLNNFTPEQDPIPTLKDYIQTKLILSRDHPAESKLFCMEVVQGAPLLIQELEQPLRQLIDSKVAVIKQWIQQGKLSNTDPYHLIFSIWAITQHYADFSVQIKALTGKDLHNPDFFQETLNNITGIILQGVAPKAEPVG